MAAFHFQHEVLAQGTAAVDHPWRPPADAPSLGCKRAFARVEVDLVLDQDRNQVGLVLALAGGRERAFHWAVAAAEHAQGSPVEAALEVVVVEWAPVAEAVPDLEAVPAGAAQEVLDQCHLAWGVH